MANPEKVILKIVSVKGICAAGHRVGQEFDLSKDFMLGTSGDPRAICPSAFNAIFPSWRVLRHGGEFPWEEDKNKATIACPDALNPVVMELRRVKE
ncbi:MAG: TIGR04076 family protein [Thermodesulfobacteriota bacterium]